MSTLKAIPSSLASRVIESWTKPPTGSVRRSSSGLDGGAGWLISAKATAKDVSDKLQITDGTSGAALIIEMASYFGRANRAIWTWIKNNLEAKDG